MSRKNRRQGVGSRRQNWKNVAKQKKRKWGIGFRIPKFLIPKDEKVIPRPFTAIDYAGGIVVFFICWAVYLHTLTPTIGFRDSGDMVTAAFVLGIPHPTGYPLYCLLGKLWMTILPIGNIAYRMNLASALCASLACMMVYFIVLKVASGQWRVASENNLTSRILSLVPAMVGALMLAFAVTFWEQAVIAEKYTLNALFATLLIFILLKWQEAMASITRTTNHELRTTKFYLYLFSFTLGLSFTHHMQTIYLVPASIFFISAVYWKKWRQEKQSLKTKSFYSLLPTLYSLLKMLCLFILPLLLYLYLPIRASANPVYNWGNPDTLDRFIRHVSGKIFEGFFASTLDEIYKNLNHIPHFLIDQFTQYFWWISLIGFLILLFKKRTTALFFSLMVIVNILLAVRYSIPNIEDYYILSYILFSVLFSLCMRFIINTIPQWRDKLILLFFIFPIILFIRHYYYNDRSNYYFGYNYGWNIVSSLDEKAIVFMPADAIIFPCYYFQYCERYRLDVALISTISLAYEWYFAPQEMWYSKMIKEQYPQIDLISSVSKDEVDLNDIPRSIEKAKVNEIMSKSTNYSVFISHNEDRGNNYILIPKGVLSKVLKSDTKTSQLYKELKISLGTFRDRDIFSNDIFKDPIWTLKIVTDYINLCKRKGIVYFNIERYNDTIKEYKKALCIIKNVMSKKVDYFIPYGNNYRSFIEEYKYKELREELLQKLILTYQVWGDKYKKNGDYLRAIDVYKKIIEIQHGNIEVRNIIGCLYALQDMYNEAIAEFKKAIEVNPTHIRSHINLASIYYHKKLFKKALNKCNEILKLDPNNTYAKQIQKAILSK